MIKTLLGGLRAGVLAVVLAAGALAPASAETLKVGVLKFGTVNWLMDVIKHHQLDQKNGFDLELVQFASNNATAVAALGGEVDSMVTDWFWALRERSQGEDFVFFPYSVTLGAVIVPDDSPIASIADLKGKRIGVAGGPLDKGWLLLRSRAGQLGAGDLAETAEPVFAAPPLLNEQMLNGSIDAVLNYWHFAARLEGEGYRQLVGVSDIMRELGFKSPPPLIGFVFRESTARDKPQAVEGFARATREAAEILIESDEEWVRLRPQLGAETDGQFEALVRRFREGMLHSWGEEERAEARRLFEILSDLGGEGLTGPGVRFDPSVFWSGPVL